MIGQKELMAMMFCTPSTVQAECFEEWMGYDFPIGALD